MEELYKEYSKLVYNYLYSLCRNTSIAEELTQDTFYKAIKNINKFNKAYKVSTWLCEIAKNTYIDYLRKEKRHNTISIDEKNSIDEILLEKPLEELVEEKSAIINLYKNIHKLDLNTREVIYLRVKGELSFKEIGEILDKSENWARLVYYRGKIELKEIMKNEEK